MKLKLMFSRVVLVTFSALLFPNGGNSSLLKMPFYKTSTGGQKLKVDKTHSDVRSTIHCARLCKQDREVEHLCESFRYHPMKKECELYARGSSVIPYPGVEIFQFQALGVFHDVYINGKLYSLYASEVKKNFFDARAGCNDLGGYLLEFDTLDEYEALKIVVNVVDRYDHYYFIGANDIAEEGAWVTDRNNEPLNNSTWVWFPGEPNNDNNGENCGTLLEGWLVNDGLCPVPIQYICEKDT